jgi:uncharacterized protein YjbI with pentapeptide repeats
MRPAPKIRPPILAKELDAIEIKRLDGLELDQCRVEGCALAGETGERIRFDGVRIVAGVLTETKLEILSFVDVLCERCDFSMVEWQKAKLTRVELRGSRVTGAKVLQGEFDNVRFVDCHLEYASFPGARFRSVSFEQCRLKEADFSGADLSGTMFTECDLDGVDFTRAKLQGADVSASMFREIRVGAGDVRGLVVSREQATAFSRLFGLVIGDES